MALSYKTGVFAANTSTGNQAVTGVGFTPKWLRLYAVPQTTDTDNNPGRFSVGMTDFTNSRSIAVAVDDNVATSNAATDASTNLLKILLDGTPSTDAIASIVSADADGFTMNWSDAPSSAWEIHYEAGGGTDITNVAVGTWAPGAGTGNKSLTGLGFQPDVVMFATSFVASAANGTSAIMGLGATSGASQEYGISFDSQDAKVSGNTVARYWHKAVTLLMQGGGTALLDATCVSLDSGGWTLNFATHGATTYAIYYLAVKGGHWRVGSETCATTATTKQTTGLGFQPTGVSIFGIFAAVTSSITAGNVLLGLGGAYGVNTSRGISCSVSNTFNQRSRSGLAAKALHVVKAGSGLQQEADMSAWDSDSFTFSYSTVSGVADEFGYIAFGSSATSTPKTLSATNAQTAALSRQTLKVLAA